MATSEFENIDCEFLTLKCCICDKKRQEISLWYSVDLPSIREDARVERFSQPLQNSQACITQTASHDVYLGAPGNHAIIWPYEFQLGRESWSQIFCHNMFPI